jgi:hypothetical protein
MAEPNPNVPPGAVPPKPGEAAKVQPKKETVRINLPPKPTAAPTVRLPTPASVGVAAPTAAKAAPAAAPSAPPPAGAPAAAPVQTAAPAPAAAGPAPRPAAAVTTTPRPSAPAPAAPLRSVTAIGISGLDKALTIAAAIIAVLAAGSVAYLAFV